MAVVVLGQDPRLEGKSAGEWSEAHKVRHVENDAFLRGQLLMHHVAEDAPFFVFEPFVRRFQFVFNPARHENGCRHLRMGVGPFLPRQPTLILEHAYVFKARILFQIRGSRSPHPQHPFDLFIAELR